MINIVNDLCIKYEWIPFLWWRITKKDFNNIESLRKWSKSKFYTNNLDQGIPIRMWSYRLKMQNTYDIIKKVLWDCEADTICNYIDNLDCLIANALEEE